MEIDSPKSPQQHRQFKGFAEPGINNDGHRDKDYMYQGDTMDWEIMYKSARYQYQRRTRYIHLWNTITVIYSRWAR